MLSLGNTLPVSRLGFLTTAATVLLLPSVAHGQALRTSDVRCDVALDYVKHVLATSTGRRLVFSAEEGPRFAPINGGWFESSDDIVHAKPIAPPASDLVERVNRTSENSVQRCASVRGLLRNGGIAYGKKAVRAARTRGVFKARIESVSLPVVSEDGKYALLERTEMRGFTDGGGWFELLEREADGSWKVIGFSPTWLS